MPAFSGLLKKFSENQFADHFYRYRDWEEHAFSGLFYLLLVFMQLLDKVCRLFQKVVK